MKPVYTFSFRIITTYLVAMFLSTVATGQMTIIDNQRIEGDQLIVEIAASGSLDVLAIQGSFRFNELSLEFNRVEILAFPTLSTDDFNAENGSSVNILWFDNDLIGKTLPSNTPLFELHFNILNTRDTEVVFANCPNEIEVIGSDDAIIPVVGNIVKDKYCAVIKGRVFQDLDRDCRNIVDPGFADVMVEVNGPEGRKIFKTDKDGFFEVIGVEGEYSVSAVPPAPFWSPCDETLEVTINSLTNPRTVELFLTPEFDCGTLQVKSSVGQLRPCEEEKVIIYYRNAGTQNIMSGQVTVTLDPRIEISEVSHTHQINDNGEIVVNTGVLRPNEVKRFHIIVETPCESSFEGRSFSIETRGTPDPLCLPPLPGWSGANLEVRAECQGGRPVMTTTNVGNSIMSAPLTVNVLENDELIITDDIQLNVGEFYRVELDASASTFTMLTRQVVGFPIQGIISASVENCLQSGNPSLGFMNQFPGKSPTNAIDRIRIPLEAKSTPSAWAKWAFVDGFGEDKDIQYQTVMDFVITVPGPGEGVSKVLVVDTLSSAFDLRTFRFINSSQDVNISFEDDNIVLFELNLNGSTMYADEFIFVHFTIGFDQTLPLPFNSMNRAHIFRRNAPMRQTNAFLFRVVEDYDDFSTSTGESLQTDDYSELKIFPNPTSGMLSLQWPDLNDQIVDIMIIDRFGRQVYHQSVYTYDSMAQIDVNSLPDGLYHVQMIAQSRTVASSFIKLSE